MHANAKLTPLMRAKLIAHHLATGSSLRASAAAFGVCEKTVRKWLKRAQAAAFPQRLDDLSSSPHHQPRKTSPQLEAQILALRRQRRSYAQILMVTPIAEEKQMWRVWLRPNSRPLVGLCELCGCFVVVAVPSAFFYEFDGSSFPVCATCAVNYGVRIKNDKPGTPCRKRSATDSCAGP
jgi:transposase-like protein